jgi:hypothetical protein
MEDDRVGVVESQLAQAKLIAEEADKKYEEVKSQKNGICSSLLSSWKTLFQKNIVILHLLGSKHCSYQSSIHNPFLYIYSHIYRLLVRR